MHEETSVTETTGPKRKLISFLSVYAGKQKGVRITSKRQNIMTVAGTLANSFGSMI